MAGIRNTDDLDGLQRTFPAVHAELLSFFARLEERYRDMWPPKFDAEFHTLDCFGVLCVVRHNGG